MDTHITMTPDLDDHVDALVSKPGAPLAKPVGVPGARQTMPHGDVDEDVADRDSAAFSETSIPQPREPLAGHTPRPRGYRKALLVTTAAVLLGAGLAAAAWTQRAQLASLPVAATAARVTGQVAALFASSPTATTASSNQPTSEIGVAADTTPQTTTASSAVAPVSPVRVVKLQEVKAALERTEFANLKLLANAVPASPAAPGAKAVPSSTLASTATPSALPTSTLPAEPATAGLAVTTPGPDHVGEVGAAKPLPAAPTAPPAPASASVKPRDPVDVAVELRAEPMAPKQMVNTVAVVTELGAQLKEARYQLRQLNAAVSEMKELLDTRMVDFEGRLGLAEAATVLAQSAKAGLTPSAATPPSSRLLTPGHSVAPAGRPVSTPVSAPVEPPSAATSKRTVKDFRIQGASPGMVVLSVLNPAPGEAPVLYLGLGDLVPGLGRVKAVQQRGTAWVAQTDAGLIQ